MAALLVHSIFRQYQLWYVYRLLHLAHDKIAVWTVLGMIRLTNSYGAQFRTSGAELRLSTSLYDLHFGIVR